MSVLIPISGGYVHTCVINTLLPTTLLFVLQYLSPSSSLMTSLSSEMQMVCFVDGCPFITVTFSHSPKRISSLFVAACPTVASPHMQSTNRAIEKYICNFFIAEASPHQIIFFVDCSE